MQLFTVHYTLARIVTSYDSAGNLIGSETLDITHTLHALPLSTAMQYANCSNFRKEPYQPDQDRGRIAHNPRQHGKSAFMGMRKGELRVVAAGKGRSAIKDAAASGDMSAAINRAVNDG